MGLVYNISDYKILLTLRMKFNYKVVLPSSDDSYLITIVCSGLGINLKL